LAQLQQALEENKQRYLSKDNDDFNDNELDEEIENIER
jgi:hypothetical protein